MKKFILLLLSTVFMLAMDFDLFDLGFTKNYFEIHKNKPIHITEIKKINFKNIKFINPKNDFVVKINKGVKIFSIEQLNKILLKNGYPYVLKVIKENNNYLYVKIVPADTLNKYDVKGIRLIKNYPIKTIINYLNKQFYTQVLYKGENFIVPKNPNIVIKNIEELKKYLDGVNDKSIIFISSVDINNDNLPEFFKYKEVINKITKGSTPLEATIKHLEYAIQLAKKINNPNFQKQLFIQDLKDTVNQLKTMNQ